MQYQAPVDDMMFLIKDVFDLENRLKGIADFSEFDAELYNAILEEAGKFATGILQPINRSGDEEGCQFDDGVVTTPKGFKEAYQAYVEGGWQSLTASAQYGGQGLPKSLHVLVEEMFYSANSSFCLYGSLTAGAYHLLQAHADDVIKDQYLAKLISGEWSGSMCLTEAHAGSDLGILKTKAEPQEDGTYKLSGSKIFITGGEHDMTDNIIHLVLARLPDAPAGPKGISLFLVPKFMVNDDGSLGERNGIRCGSIEHKMGIKASSTCVINMDDATGFIIGGPHQGLRCMFTMMNLERLSIGLQGVGLGEMSYQQAFDYANDRLQGRAEGVEGTAPIIRHGDVQRMLKTMQAYTQAGRALAVWLGAWLDEAFHSEDEAVVSKAQNMAALLTPVAKAFFTDIGYEVCTIGQQVFGGHGYVREWGMEQHVRDARIAQIYEGTNGIQALDLIGRKIVSNKGAFLSELLTDMRDDMQSFSDTSHKVILASQLEELESLSIKIVEHFSADQDKQQYIACDYLHYMALSLYAYLWLKMAETGKDGKKESMQFFFNRLLPRAYGLKKSIENELGL
ncbi:acyl-CoA dehydrogenase family protein [Kangiella koreensis]|uniref:3-methylmercaptopropionyl-CoA dehydrogenase n=1 Tax=Kangiella koreensis (strain DSM 16069 / JCM 12317 / KCTC 12182 / SW-125) TaxID=523791 RepID=C7RC28_KANKD|nr:acyl-CoA dehydrogenase family protein [Kangiella koreensis]ACV26820.1 acyl-CoA dehydrogenase domain protein [Kangiella koreensis DSM 16069]